MRTRQRENGRDPSIIDLADQDHLATEHGGSFLYPLDDCSALLDEDVSSRDHVVLLLWADSDYMDMGAAGPILYVAVSASGSIACRSAWTGMTLIGVA